MCHSTPHHIRSDNESEFVANRVKRWIINQGCQTIYIEPGHLWEKPIKEHFISTLKNDCLNRYLFDTLPEAQELRDNWRLERNAYRPPNISGYITPDAFVTHYSEMILKLDKIKCYGMSYRVYDTSSSVTTTGS